jgi:hypothetical protein
MLAEQLIIRYNSSMTNPFDPEQPFRNRGDLSAVESRALMRIGKFVEAMPYGKYSSESNRLVLPRFVSVVHDYNGPESKVSIERGGKRLRKRHYTNGGC